MREFFLANMDYIFFVYGLSFVLLAITSFSMSRTRPTQVFWKWLFLFGLIHGITEWLDMLALSWGDNILLQMLRTASLTTSFLCFMEIARSHAEKRHGRMFGPWIYAPFLIVTLGSGWILNGTTGVNILSRYIFGTLGGLLAAGVIRASAAGPKEQHQDRTLVVFAWLLGCYALTQSIVPQGKFFPASVIHQDAFLSLLGFPIQFIRMLLATTLAILAWQEYFEEMKKKYIGLAIPKHFRKELVLPLGLVIILLAGLVLTDFVGQDKDEEERSDLLKRIRVAAAAINPLRVKALSGTPADLENEHYKRLQEQFLNILQDSPDLLYVYLFGQKDGKYIFLIDSELPGRMVSSQPVAIPGEIYTEDAELLKRLFTSDGYTAIGPETDKWGTFVSGLVALRDSTNGKVLAVLGFDYDAHGWARMIATQRLQPILITFLFAFLFITFLVILKHEQAARQNAQWMESELKKLMTQLGEEGKNLTTIFDSTQVGLLLIDSQFRVKRSNRVILDMVGDHSFSTADQQPGDVLSCIHAKEEEVGCGGTPACKVCPVRAAAKKILQTGEIIRDAEALHRIRLPNGKQRSVWIEMNASPVEIKGERHILFSLANITARKEVEEALRISRAKLDLAVKGSHMGVWEFDITRDKRIFDDQTCSLLGIDPATFRGTTEEFFNRVHPADRERVKKTLAETLEKGVPYEPEYRAVWPDRSIHHIVGRGNLVRDEAGTPQTILGLVWDITELRRAEEARQESILEYRDLFENMQSAFAVQEIIMDENGVPVDYTFLKANQAFEKMFNLSKNDYEGKRVTEIFPRAKNDSTDWIGRFGKIALQGGTTSFEHYSEAYKKWLSVTAYQPKPGQFATMFADDTARKNAETALEASLEYLFRIIDALADPIFVKDSEHRWVLVNKAFCDFMGHTAEELKGKSDYDFFPKKEADVFWAKDSEVFRTGKENVNEEFFTDGAGLRRTIITKKTIYKDPAGRDQLVGIIRDITELKRAVEAAKKEQLLSNAIINSIPGAFYVLDANGRYVRWNDYQRDEIIGKPEGQIAGRSALETIHPDDRALIQSKIVSVLETGKEAAVEGRVLLRGGPAFRWLLMTGQQMVIDDKLFLVGVGVDINERKNFEQEARKRLQELEIFYKASIGREERIVELKKEIERLKH